MFIEKASGIAIISGKSISFISPCVFCVNEKEHIIINDCPDNLIKVIYLHPCIINSSLNFDNIRNLPDPASFTLLQDNDLLQLFVNREDGYLGKFDLGPASAKRFSTLYGYFLDLVSNQNDPNWPCSSRSYLMWLLFLLKNLHSIGEYSKDSILGTVDEKLHYQKCLRTT